MNPRGLLRVGAGIGLMLCLAHSRAGAHPLDPALLELGESSGGRVSVLWRQPRSEPLRAPLRPVLPRHCSADAPRVVSDSGPRVTSRWTIQCGAGGLAGHAVGVEGLKERGTDALLRIQLAGAQSITAVLRPDHPVLVVPARRSGLAVAREYVQLGVDHILTGYDHLAFVVGLVLLVHGRRRLMWTITAFTAGHSVTLSLATLGVIRLPPAPVEVLISMSILAIGVELARPQPAAEGWMRRAPWAMAFAFGLLHGLGFAGALGRIGLPANEIPVALLAFNGGVEVGQLGIVGGAVMLRRALRSVGWSEAGSPVPAYAIGSLAAFWMIERIRSMLV